jgi:PfaD family protein
MTSFIQGINRTAKKENKMKEIKESEKNKVIDLIKQIESKLYIYIKNSKFYISDKPLDNRPDYIIPEFNFSLQKKFLQRFNLKYPYIAGAMAKGISSEKMVRELSKSGCMGDFGSAGLSHEKILKTAENLKADSCNFLVNIINIPGNQENELNLLKELLKRDVRSISAGAYIRMTKGLVYFRVKGIKKENDQILIPNKILAKISRKEVAENFLKPPPLKIIKKLEQEKLITKEEAKLSQLIPMSSDIIAEADSGGHTDKQPAVSLFPEILFLKDIYQKNYPDIYLSAGLAGGISTPHSALAAFSMGADFIMTGSINQSCLEAGTSDLVKEMLSKAKQGDFETAPSADTFEMGGKVQVLKKENRFASRANFLGKIFQNSDSIEDINKDDREFIENTVFEKSLKDEWETTKEYFNKTDAGIIEKAEQNPKKKMALIFRSYLGQSSWWAINGIEKRKNDFQIWAGHSMAAFNSYVKNSPLEDFKNRKASEIALKILNEAGILSRINFINSLDIPVHFDLKDFW